MNRPTIAATMICKNEVTNFPRLLESIKDCFDEIIIVDTGSTDGTIEYIKSLIDSGNDKRLFGAPIRLEHFKWIDNFAAARNETLKYVTSDYFFWIDLDDILVDKESFINWRNTAMAYADYWLAAYDYAQDEKGVSQCKFMRERVISMKGKPGWEYFVHEGVKVLPGYRPQYVPSWYVKHQRTVDDMKKDKSRNLKMFQPRLKELCPRMEFYYGKELFENEKPMEAFSQLTKALELPLEPHDRMLAYQYAGYAAMQCNQYQRARDISFEGLKHAPFRAEYFVTIGESYLKENNMISGYPYFAAAKHCVNQCPTDGKFFSPIYNVPALYTVHPRNMIAKIKFHLGEVDEAIKEAEECWAKYKDNSTKIILDELIRQKDRVPEVKEITDTKDCEDFVVTTPPVQAYPWDEAIYQRQGLGGSETACVEMCAHIKKKTGRNVIVFNDRKDELVSESGVKYLPNTEMKKYFDQYRPKVHIAMRHNIKVTSAPTYLWCHDLVTPGVETSQNFDKILCLSEFHRDYVMAMQGVPSDKIVLTRNGINPDRFSDSVEKDPNMIIWPNSPDRGLDRAILIVEDARVHFPDLELHVFYGLDNMKKFGMGEHAAYLEKMMGERPWVKYHGNVDQKTLAEYFKKSSVWLYPANFIETFCISALEALSAGAYPLVREFGALKNTVRWACDNGMATLMDKDAAILEDRQLWVSELTNIIRERRWERVKIDPKMFSWESVADEWIKMMGL